MKTGNVNHPLVRPKREPIALTPEQLAVAMRLPGDPGVVDFQVTDDAIDQIAADVRRLPVSLTKAQRERLAIIARELMRMAW